MSKAEKFIEDYTKNCCNIEYTKGYYPPSYQPWLTPDQARKAVEIAREEMFENLCEFLDNDLCCYIKAQHFTIENQRLENALKQAMKMSEAVNAALEAYPIESDEMDDDLYIRRNAYVKGYHQAEKDFELTWKDFAIIRLAFDATEANINLGSLKISQMTKEYYEEVLKRFKNYKNGNNR